MFNKTAPIILGQFKNLTWTMKKLIVLIVIIIISILGYNYVYKEHRNIEQEMPEYIFTSDLLDTEFKSDLIASEQKLNNKTIEVKGQITEINDLDLTIDNVVFCQFKTSVKDIFKINSYVIVKGRCIGYDELLEQVKLDQCAIIN